MLEESVFRKLRCPQCDSSGPFKINTNFIVSTSATFAFRNSAIVWSDDSAIHCGCGQKGRVFDFLNDYRQVIPHQQQIKSIERRNEELQDCLASLVNCYAFEDIDSKLHSGGVPALQKAFVMLGLADPCLRSDLVPYLFTRTIEEENSDFTDIFLT